MTPPVPPAPAVEAIGWGWRHPGRRAWAVRGLDVRIEPGERVLLLGPSGAGKSTLLLALAGLLDTAGGGESEGVLRVDGRDPRAARDGTGLLLQDPESQLVMGRAGDDVAFGLENRCVPADQIWSRVDAALDAVGFPYGRQRPTHALSGGEQQRLALASTLALRPSLLLLDEPTANLDPQGAAAVREVLARVLDRIGATLVMVEHRVDAVVEMADRALVLEAGGGLIADGAPWQVFSRFGDELAAAGVWVPQRPIAAPPKRAQGPGDTLVLADGAGFTYPGTTQPALVPTDVGLRASEAVAITGPNGSGKSTLAMLLGGLLRPEPGAVVAGEALATGHGREPLWQWDARRLVGAIGTVFQDPEHQFLATTVAEELVIGPLRTGTGLGEARERAGELLGRLHLAHLADANPFTLSGGEQRRLSVATALATAPSVLVLDEPTYGQDRRTWIELLDLLAGLRDEGRAVCVVSHDLDFVRLLADRVIALEAPR